MKVITICKYCDNHETFYVYDKSSVDSRKCEKCGDKNKKVISCESTDVFGYNYGEDGNGD